MTKVFVDDERGPIPGWIVLRTFEETVQYLSTHPFPEFLSLDHDLGYGRPTGMDIVKWMIQRDLDMGGKFLPLNALVRIRLHSANPVGRDNMVGLLESYSGFRSRGR